MSDPLWKMVLGLGTGIAFGILLQKGRVAKFRVILGQFLLHDWTVVKIMGTAIAIGGIGVYALLPTEAVSLDLKPLIWMGIILGGICFGVGMAIFGYCPGTGVAACGEGRRDAMVGLAGMLAGAGVYVALYPQINSIMLALGNQGPVALTEWTASSPWLWFGGFIVLFVLGTLIRERKRNKHRRVAGRT